MILSIQLFRLKLNELCDYFENRGHANINNNIDTTQKLFPSPTSVSLNQTSNHISRNTALAIEGAVNSKIIQNNNLHEIYLKILTFCESIILFRANPTEKADLIKFIRNKTDIGTLAIGDGGNDIQMIKAAHIGIGIYGREGNQAAFNSDFAIGEFCILWRLLMIHGQLSAHRMNFFVCFFFYKNLIIFFQEFIFGFYCGFSGHPYFEGNDSLLYSSLFTSIPIVFFSIFDQDFDLTRLRNILKEIPKLYSIRREYSLFNFSSYIFWFILALIHSLILFFILRFGIQISTFESNGKIFNIESFQFISFASTFLSQLLIIFAYTKSWNIFTFVFNITSGLLIYFPFYSFINSSISRNFYLLDCLSNGFFYFFFLLLNGRCLIIVLFIESLKRFVYNRFINEIWDKIDNKVNNKECRISPEVL